MSSFLTITGSSGYLSQPFNQYLRGGTCDSLPGVAKLKPRLHGPAFYFIVSGEISVYLVKIKVVSITSELIAYHFTSD